MKRIRSQCLIDRRPDDVWGCSLISVTSRMELAQRLGLWGGEGWATVQVRLVDAGGGKNKIVSQRVTVTACDPLCRLERTGHIPLLFSPERLERQRSAYEALNRALGATPGGRHRLIARQLQRAASRLPDSRVGILKWVNDARSNPIVGRPKGIFSSDFDPSITPGRRTNEA